MVNKNEKHIPPVLYWVNYCQAVGVSWLYSTQYICAGAFYRVCSVAHQCYHYGNDPILPFSLWP